MSDSVKSKKSDKRRRVRLVAVRLTEGEYARVSEAAALADVTIPDYLRSTGLRRPLSQGRKIGGTVAAPADLRRLLGEVNKIGSNLNQIARTANVAAISGQPLTFQGLIAALDDLEDLRMRIRSALGVSR